MDHVQSLDGRLQNTWRFIKVYVVSHKSILYLPSRSCFTHKIVKLYSKADLLDISFSRRRTHNLTHSGSSPNVYNRCGDHALCGCTSNNINHCPSLSNHREFFQDLRCINSCIHDVTLSDFSGTSLSLSYIDMRYINSKPTSSIVCE